MQPAIELRKINKSFGPVRANRDIDLKVTRGTIHGIVGENGAGKSTLMSILYAFYQADSGDILINGREVELSSTQDAIAAGIGMVFQHFMLVDNFTVLENVLLGAEEGALLDKGFKKVRQTLERLEAEYDIKVDPDAVISDLPVGLQQRVEILKALCRGADILILDEPTGVLTPSEADHLFRVLKRLKDEGKTIVLITHKLREIMAVTDEVSVMRGGEMVATRKTTETNVEELAELMVGRRVLMRVDKTPAKPADIALDVQSLTVIDQRGIPVVHDLSLCVRRGEILGLAGVAGNGQSELLETIAGITRPSAGDIILNGVKVSADANRDPAKMRDWSLAHVPEDRHRMGLVVSFEACENAVLGYHRCNTLGTGLLFDKNKVQARSAGHISAYDIRPPSCRLKTANFSGGNQQKIVLAREIEQDPDVLIVGQPTRGVDIGAIEFIHKRLIEMRDAGKAILLVSVELDEIRALSDRIAVMFEGRLVGECGPDAPESQLGLMMAGIAPDADSQPSTQANPSSQEAS